MEKRFYTSANSYGLRTILKSGILGYKNSFYLARQLAKRDISAQHRQSLLGLFWVIIPVLVNSIVWITLQATGTVRVTETAVPYPLYVIVGTTLWSLISECILLPITNINANKSIITKINFDKEGLITLGILKFGLNFLIKIAIVALFLIFYKVSITNSLLWFLPLLIISLIGFISIGILLAPIGILYNDVSRIIPIFFQFAMYATPVVYMSPKSGLMREIMRLNPFSYWINDLRNALTGHPIENMVFWIVLLLFAVVIFFIAIIVYRVSMPIITERMSA